MGGCQEVVIMAIVQIKSTHPNFSFLIKKNPNSGMMLRSIHKGVAYGWYTDKQTYDITHQAHKSYALTVTTNKSLYQLLHVVSVLCLFLTMFGNESAKS